MNTPRKREKAKAEAGSDLIIEDAVKKLPISQQVVERLNKLKFCPVTKLVELAKTANSAYVQLEASKCLLDKIAPSLKAVEIDGNSTNNAYQLNIYYSTSHAKEMSEDPFNKVLKQIKPQPHDS